MPYAFVINEEDEIKHFSYDTCIKTVRWVASYLKAELGSYDGGYRVRAMEREMADAGRSIYAEKAAQAVIRKYYKMAIAADLKNDAFHEMLKEKREGVAA